MIDKTLKEALLEDDSKFNFFDNREENLKDNIATLKALNKNLEAFEKYCSERK